MAMTSQNLLVHQPAKNSVDAARTAPGAQQDAGPAAGSGAPFMLPFSLEEGDDEPEKVMAPMAAPSSISMRLGADQAPR